MMHLSSFFLIQLQVQTIILLVILLNSGNLQVQFHAIKNLFWRASYNLTFWRLMLAFLPEKAIKFVFLVQDKACNAYSVWTINNNRSFTVRIVIALNSSFWKLVKNNVYWIAWFMNALFILGFMSSGYPVSLGRQCNFINPNCAVNVGM